MTKARQGLRLLSSTGTEAPAWSSREDQARAARLDRELDAQIGGAQTAGPQTAGPQTAGAQTAGAHVAGELSAALEVAAGLRVLAERGLAEPPEESLVALRAAIAAARGRGSWRAMTPVSRLGLSGIGAVAAAVIGAAAWSGVTGSNTPGRSVTDLRLVSDQLNNASRQISQANEALAKNDPVAAKQDLAAAKVSTDQAAVELKPVVAPAPASPANQPTSLSARLEQAQATITSYQQALAALEATTTTSVPAVPAVTGPTTAPRVVGPLTTPTSQACVTTTSSSTTTTAPAAAGTTTTTSSLNAIAAKILAHKAANPTTADGNIAPVRAGAGSSSTGTSDTTGSTTTSSTSSTTTSSTTTTTTEASPPTTNCSGTTKTTSPPTAP